MDSLRRGQSVGIGGQSGYSLNLRLTTDFFEKGMILKGPSTCQKLLYEPEIQTCTWLATLWVTLHTARGADLGDLARKYYDVAKVADFGPPDGPPPGSLFGWGPGLVCG